MKQEGSSGKQAKGRNTLHKLCTMSSLVLSVVCWVAIIRVEVTIHQHHRLISNLATFCAQMEKDIHGKVQRYHGVSEAMKDQQWTEPIGN